MTDKLKLAVIIPMLFIEWLYMPYQLMQISAKKCLKETNKLQNVWSHVERLQRNILTPGILSLSRRF